MKKADNLNHAVHFAICVSLKEIGYLRLVFKKFTDISSHMKDMSEISYMSLSKGRTCPVNLGIIRTCLSYAMKCL